MFDRSKYYEIRKLEAFLGVTDEAYLRDLPSYEKPWFDDSNREECKEKVLFVLDNDYPEQSTFIFDP